MVMKMKIIKSILSLRQKTPKRHKRLVKNVFLINLFSAEFVRKVGILGWHKITVFYIISTGPISRNIIFLTKMSLT